MATEGFYNAAQAPPYRGVRGVTPLRQNFVGKFTKFTIFSAKFSNLSFPGNTRRRRIRYYGVMERLLICYIYPRNLLLQTNILQSWEPRPFLSANDSTGSTAPQEKTLGTALKLHSWYCKDLPILSAKSSNNYHRVQIAVYIIRCTHSI